MPTDTTTLTTKGRASGGYITDAQCAALDTPRLSAILREVEAELRAVASDLGDDEITFDWEQRSEAQQRLCEALNKLGRI